MPARGHSNTLFNRFAIRVVVGYCFGGVLYILLAQALVANLASAASIRHFAIAARLLFFAATATLFVLLLRHARNFADATATRYLDLIESIRDVYIVASRDADGAFTYVSPSVKTVLGYDPEAMIGEQGPPVPADTQGLYEATYVATDGTPRTFEIATRPIVDERGRYVGRDSIARDITIRKEIEARRERVQVQFRRLVEQAPIGVAMFDRDMNYLVVSRRWAELVEGGRTDLEGLNHYALHPNLPEEWVAAHRAGLRGETVSNEKAHWNDGADRWASWVIRPWHEDDGSIGGIIVTGEDITSRMQAEQALRDSEAKFRSYIDLAPVMVTLIGADGRYRDSNPEFARALGLGRDAIAGMHCTDILVDGEHDDVTTNLAALLDRGGAAAGEYRCRTADGRVVWLAGRAVRLDDGTVLAFQTDVTEQRLNEERLRQAAAVFASTREGVVVTDLDGTIRSVNASVCRITGYDESELIGSNMRLIRSGRHDGDFYGRMWTTILRDGFWQGEIWNRRKNGEIFPGWLSISRVVGDVGSRGCYVGVFSDISEVKQSHDEIEFLAHHDPLTQLPNRMLLLSRLQHALERSRRDAVGGAVLFLDLDRFKHINDGLGHAAGDELLCIVAARLRAHLRESDTLARIGGDEFVVVLEGAQTPGAAATVAAALIEELNKPVLLSGAREIRIGASVGISLYPNDSVAADNLIQYADTALYQAKSSGRNTYRFYTAALTEASNYRLALEARLHRAIEECQFVLHYQPLIDAATNRSRGMEALVRWAPPGEGMIPPMQFIPLAEDTGLIIPLGAWILEEACRQMAEWLAQGLPLDTIAVNLSPRQFMQPDVVDQVRGALERTGLPPRYLELEIVERALMQDGAANLGRIQALHDLGVRLAIDDFGTGYSSLAYLKRFPLHKLKIDRSFVEDIPDDPAGMEIAATIIAMAKTLHLEVLAEGVETEAQMHFLKDRGCDTFQGHLFSRARPAAEIPEFVLTGRRRRLRLVPGHEAVALDSPTGR